MRNSISNLCLPRGNRDFCLIKITQTNCTHTLKIIMYHANL